MEVEELIENFPFVYHMAEGGSWDNIQRYGLLSTSSLLNLYKINGKQRNEIELEHRPECVTIECKDFAPAVVRDQKPMSVAGLNKALLDGISPTDWFAILNSKTFFWATEERLYTLLNARAYRDRPQDVLTIDTRELVKAHECDIVLSPYNSGSTKPNPFKRGRDTFLPIRDYPFGVWRKRRGTKSKALAEVCVEGGVPEIKNMVVAVRKMIGSEIIEKIL